ncbi:hypothetical protein NUW58_g8235 [Xylaria curta]|uniref:Uncharacterized protein n=1 Tax=Xylaria curta TaxID=42375 RepID=A0ACC1N9F1_9PEZI|nr:hypothetical protein NUW58_g8235 [Xylaria curta]
MNPGQGTQLPLVFFLPSSAGVLPSLRTLNIPQQHVQASSSPLWMLTQAAQLNGNSTHHQLEGGPQRDALWAPEGELWPAESEPRPDSDVSSSGDVCRDFARCLRDQITMTLDWYQSSVIAMGDVEGLARQVQRFIRAACIHYAEQGTVPSMREVQLRPSTIPFPTPAPAGGELTVRPATAPPQSESTGLGHDASPSLTFTEEDQVVTQDYASTESSLEGANTTVSSTSLSYMGFGHIMPTTKRAAASFDRPDPNPSVMMIRIYIVFPSFPVLG